MHLPSVDFPHPEGPTKPNVSRSLSSKEILFKISFLDFKNLSMSVAGAFIGFVFLWLVNFFFNLIKGYNGIGGGDFILLASLGSITGPFALPFIILFGSLASILIYFLKIKVHLILVKF